MSKYCKLVMVSPDNRNKFYIMEEKNGSIAIEYGRIDSSSRTDSKPMSHWSRIYNSKVKKGYKDVTDVVTVKVDNDSGEDVVLKDIKDSKVNRFISLMQAYVKNLTTSTYSVSFKNVTAEQVKRAQQILDDFENIDKKNVKLVNEKLVELYTIIPRKMNKVPNYLLPNITLDKHLEKEQDNIDAMSSQVEIYEKEKASKSSSKTVEERTLLDLLGIDHMAECPNKVDELQYLINQVSSRNKIEGVFELNKPFENNLYDKYVSNSTNKSSRLLIHGTRCSSVIPILEQGLKIRPAGNFQFSGKVYGNANYFSEVVSKSLNYTGYDKDKILLVYEVHTGNPFIYNGWYRGNSFTLNYKNLKDRGYDSTYVKAGGGLLNSEIVSYHEHQNRIKYIIWLK